MKTETTLDALLASEELLVHDAMAGITVHVEEAVNKLVLESLTANKKGIYNCLLVVLEVLVINSVHKVVNSPEFMIQSLNAVIRNPGFIAAMVACDKSEQRKLVAEQAKIKDIGRHFGEAGRKRDLRPVLIQPEGSAQPLNDLSDGRTSPIVYFIQQSKSVYGLLHFNAHNQRMEMNDMRQDRYKP